MSSEYFNKTVPANGSLFSQTDDQVIDTRIILKHDSLETWNNSNTTLVLEKGEIALASITGSDGIDQYFMKIGDGLHKFPQLKYLSATASDVYTWAKGRALPVTIEGTGNTIINARLTTDSEGYAIGLVLTKGDRVVSVEIGNGLDNTGTIIQPVLKHADTSNADGITKTKNNLVSTVTLDDFGHVTAAGTTEILVKHDGENIKVTDTSTSADKVEFTVEHTTVGNKAETKGNITGEFITSIDVDANGHISSVGTARASLTTVSSAHPAFTPIKVTPETIEGGTNYKVQHTAPQATTPPGWGSSNVTSSAIYAVLTDEYGHIVETTSAPVKDTTYTLQPCNETDDNCVKNAIHVKEIEDVSGGTSGTESQPHVTYQIGINKDAILGLVSDSVTAAMEFKGAITVLPENLGETDKGNLYKIAPVDNPIPVTTKDKGSELAKPGDFVVWDGDGWYLLPAGDDIEDTWRPIHVNGTDIENDTLKLLAGDKIVISLDEVKDNIANVTISHATYDRADPAAVKVGRDEYGHVILGNKLISSDIEFPPVSDPTVDPTETSVEFIDSISQDENGKITATKKKVSAGSTTKEGIVKLGAVDGAELFGTASGLINNLNAGPFECTTVKTVKSISQTKGLISVEFQDIKYPGISVICEKITGTDSHDGQAVTSIKAEIKDGKYEITETHGSVSTDYIKQGTKTLVFNCGTSTTVI